MCVKTGCGLVFCEIDARHDARRLALREWIQESLALNG